MITVVPPQFTDKNILSVSMHFNGCCPYTHTKKICFHSGYQLGDVFAQDRSPSYSARRLSLLLTVVLLVLVTAFEV
ncbi:MAG: hypothetical protein E7505_07190 [Ruminococcus sp.]|nr:hypothetical protein [Ruminococcus sp.]